MFLRSILFLFFISTIACGRIPSDPEKSFEKAQNSGLAVGFSHNPPWVFDLDTAAEGVEANLIREFALINGLNVVWQKGSEQKLMKMLEEKELHIVISGLTKDNPWKSQKIGLTLPYFKAGKEKHVIAIQQGENRLLMELEQVLKVNKDSINNMIDAYKQKF